MAPWRWNNEKSRRAEMGRSRFNLFLLVLIAGTLVLAWVVGRDVRYPNYESKIEGQMGRSPAYGSFAPNPNFPDKLTLRSPIAGTIAQGQLPFPYKATTADALRAGQELRNPFPTEELEKRRDRGREVFANFCQVCHGPLGLGDGPVTQGGFPPPPSLLADRAVRMPEGQMFHVLTCGQGRMPAVAAQLSREDRWCSILYVRELQQFHVPSTPQPPVTLAEVTQLYRQNCSSCHGEDGTGNLVRKALPNIPDFTSLAWQVSQTEIALVNQIDYGSLPLMPAFRYKLTREQIQGLAVYVRSFPSRKAAPPAPVLTHLSPVAVYQTYCFACHDTTGRGDPFMRKTMPEIPDFTSAPWQDSRTDKDLGDSILHGKGKFMLPMKDKLGPVNVEEMVTLVRKFKDGKQVIPLAAPKLPGPPPPEGPIAKLPPDFKAPPEVKLPPDVKQTPAPSGELATRIRLGAITYQQFCFVCHGSDGTGSVTRASMPPIPNFTDPNWQRRRGDAELMASILNGKGTLMPANNSRITRAQARDLVAFIRAFGPRGTFQPVVTDVQFEREFRRLQQQWDALEKALKELKDKPG
jgi:mono/diheme cytochrome c family protein